jgi:THO complex subunit 4
MAQRVKPVAVKPPAVPPRRVVRRKGPKRLKKRIVTVEDLDKEMDDYRAAAPEDGYP